MQFTYTRLREFRGTAEQYLATHKQTEMVHILEILMRRTKNLKAVEDVEDTVNMLRNKYATKDEKGTLIYKEGNLTFTEESSNLLQQEVKVAFATTMNLPINPKYYVKDRILINELTYQQRETFSGFMFEDDLATDLAAYDEGAI